MGIAEAATAALQVVMVVLFALIGLAGIITIGGTIIFGLIIWFEQLLEKRQIRKNKSSFDKLMDRLND